MNTRNEQSLLMCIARRDLDEARTSQRRTLLQTPLDSSYIVENGRQHGLNPHLQRHLNAVPSDVPPDEFAQIRQETMENSRSDLYLVTHLLIILKRFQEE